MMRRQHGFTLVEIAIVLAIVGLLLGGLLVPLSAQVDSQRNSETVKTLNDIREALTGFALANGRLPCPADPTVPSGTAGAGVERASCNTGNNMHGVVPWTTLGVPETDAWGRRYTYRVASAFADPIASATYGAGCTPTTTPTQSSFALCSPGDITVTDGAVNIATNVPAVIVSHGKNGLGAYTSAGIPLPASTDPGELDNSTIEASLPYTFVSHAFTPTFDDQVVWISINILINRMVAAQKLP